MTENIHGDSKSEEPTHNNHGCESCRDHVVFCHFCRDIVPLALPDWLLASDCFAMTGDDDAEFVQYIEEYFFLSCTTLHTLVYVDNFDGQQ